MRGWEWVEQVVIGLMVGLALLAGLAGALLSLSR